jgi:hypothetical protein
MNLANIKLDIFVIKWILKVKNCLYMRPEDWSTMLCLKVAEEKKTIKQRIIYNWDVWDSGIVLLLPTKSFWIKLKVC